VAYLLDLHEAKYLWKKEYIWRYFIPRFPKAVPLHDRIFRACKARQLEVVQTLFENKLALPWDIDSSGKGLLEHVIFPDIAEPDSL
jgi:hypothetical protein